MPVNPAPSLGVGPERPEDDAGRRGDDTPAGAGFGHGHSGVGPALLRLPPPRTPLGEWFTRYGPHVRATPPRHMALHVRATRPPKWPACAGQGWPACTGHPGPRAGPGFYMSGTPLLPPFPCSFHRSAIIPKPRPVPFLIVTRSAGNHVFAITAARCFVFGHRPCGAQALAIDAKASRTSLGR